MNISKSIHYKLANDATVAGIVASRIYQVVIPQSATYPAIMIQKISDVPFSDDHGNDLFRARIQVNSYHTNYADCKTLATAVMNAIDFITQTTINSMAVVEISIEDENELIADFAGFEGIFIVAQDYSVTYQRG